MLLRFCRSLVSVCFLSRTTFHGLTLLWQSTTNCNVWTKSLESVPIIVILAICSHLRPGVHASTGYLEAFAFRILSWRSLVEKYIQAIVPNERKGFNDHFFGLRSLYLQTKIAFVFQDFTLSTKHPLILRMPAKNPRATKHVSSNDRVSRKPH